MCPGSLHLDRDHPGPCQESAREADLLDGIENLALFGVRTTQTTTWLTVPQPSDDTTLAVTRVKQATARCVTGDLPLDQDATLAELAEPSGAAALSVGVRGVVAVVSTRRA